MHVTSRHITDQTDTDRHLTGQDVTARHVVAARLAAVAAVLSSTVALTDAISVGVTGEGSVFTTGPTWVQHASVGAHGVMFALFAVLLVRLAVAVDAGRRGRRWCRRILVAVFVVLAVPNLAGIVAPLDQAPEALTVPVTLAFVAGFPVSAVLGLLLLRAPGLRLPAAVLAAGIAAFAGVLLLAALAPTWAHPGYVEVPQYLGIALLVLRLAPAHRPEEQQAGPLVAPA